MVGIVGKKLGMSRIYTDKGVVVPVTLIEVYDSVVVEVQEFADKDYNNIVIAYNKPKNPEKKLTKSVIGEYKKKNLDPHRHKIAIRFSKDKSFNVGDTLKADVLKDLSSVDVTGISKGKGFAGGMKRWHFQGLEAAHGVSISHRSIGSTGNRMSPSKVFKGKKMPGQLGNKQTTIKNLDVVEVRPEENLVVVKGAIPGGKGQDVIIKKVRR
ncbi:MAG: 50S ribosomal protein L3 [Rickettsiales bacterium]|jgi:large subunit ribosomal protein L3|nr:50S ribosomal protein L3 [Rickettsiales bacterium]